MTAQGDLKFLKFTPAPKLNNRVPYDRRVLLWFSLITDVKKRYYEKCAVGKGTRGLREVNWNIEGI
jgi:hypothetical protein